MSGLKISAYPVTQTVFNDADEFDVSAYVAPSVWETRKFSYASLFASFVPSGNEGNMYAYHSGQWVATDIVEVDFSASALNIWGDPSYHAGGIPALRVSPFGDLLWNEISSFGDGGGFKIIDYQNSPVAIDNGNYLKIKIQGVEHWIKLYDLS